MWVADVWRDHVEEFVDSKLFRGPQVMMGGDILSAGSVPEMDAQQLELIQQPVGVSVPPDVLANLLKVEMGGPRHRRTPAEHQLFDNFAKHEYDAVKAALAADPRLRKAINQDSQTILFPAIGAHRKDVVVAAIAAGADVNHRDRKGWTPLIQAASIKGDNCIGELLATRGIKLAETTNIEWPALMTALTNGHCEQSLALVKAGASVLQPNTVGVTPRGFVDEFEVPPELDAAIRSRG